MKIIFKSIFILIVCFITWINLDLKSQSGSKIDLNTLINFANAQDESGYGSDECYTVQYVYANSYNYNGCLISELITEECHAGYDSGSCWEGSFAVLYQVDNSCNVTDTSIEWSNDSYINCEI